MAKYKLVTEEEEKPKKKFRLVEESAAPRSRAGMVTEGAISREEYMRQRGPVNEAAPSAADGSLIPMASRNTDTLQTDPLNLRASRAALGMPDKTGGLYGGSVESAQTPGYKPVVSEDMLRPGPLGMNAMATSQALDGPNALRSEKMTMAQSGAMGIVDVGRSTGALADAALEVMPGGEAARPSIRAFRAANEGQGPGEAAFKSVVDAPSRMLGARNADADFEEGMTRSLEDNPVSTVGGQTVGFLAGGPGQLTTKAYTIAPKAGAKAFNAVVSPAIAARVAAKNIPAQLTRFTGRVAANAPVGALDYYGFNYLAGAQNEARMSGQPIDRAGFANSQVFTPGGAIAAAAPGLGIIPARAARYALATTKNAIQAPLSKALPGVVPAPRAGITQASKATPANVQQAVAAGPTIANPLTPKSPQNDINAAYDHLLKNNFDPDVAETAVRLASYDGRVAVDEMLGELTNNPKIEQIMLALARVGGDAKKTIRAAFEDRNAEMPDRIRVALRDALGLSGDDMESFGLQMASKAKEATAEGYAAAYGKQVSDDTWGKIYQRLLDTTDGYSPNLTNDVPDAILAARAGAREARATANGNKAQLDAARQLDELAGALMGRSAQAPKLSTHALDFLDRGFGSRITDATPGTKRSLIGLRNAVRDSGLDADTGLNEPRTIYAQYMAAKEAMEFGQKAATNGTPLRDMKSQFAAAMRSADEAAEKGIGEGKSVIDQALVMGWLRGAEDIVEKAPNPGTVIRQLFGSERQRAKMLAMMPELPEGASTGELSDQTKRIKALVGSKDGKPDYKYDFELSSGQRAKGKVPVKSVFERQREMLNNQNRVSGNSQTADAQEAIAAQGGIARMADATARAVMNPAEAARNAALWAVANAPVFRPAIFKPGINRELGRILSTRGRDELLKVIAEIRARQAATGKGPKPPTAPGTPPRGTPPSGSPTPSPNALAPQGPIRAAGFGGFGKGYVDRLNDTKTIAEAAEVIAGTRFKPAKRMDRVATQDDWTDATEEAADLLRTEARRQGGTEAEIQVAREFAPDSIADPKGKPRLVYEDLAAQILRSRGIDPEPLYGPMKADRLTNAERGVNAKLMKQAKGEAVVNDRMAEELGPDVAAGERAKPRTMNGLPLRGDLGNALAGAGLGAFGPADSNEERLRNMAVGAGIGFGARRVGKAFGAGADDVATAGVGGPRKPVPPRTPGKSKLGTRTADAAAIAALSIAPPAQADTGGANAELEAANERVRIASDRVLQIEKTAIPQLENDLRLIEDPKADPRALQELLARRGLYKGPIDGVIGPQSRGAIAENRKMIRDDLQTQRAELEKARKEETAARQGLKQAEMREIQRKAEPNAALNLAGLVGTTAAIAGGIYLAKKGRAGAVAKSVPAAASATRKANALIAAKAKAPTTAKTGPNSVNERAAKVNEFWKQGGAGKKVPFTVDDKGAWNARPNATEPAELFNPKWYQQYRSGDALAMSVAALDAGGSRLGINKLNEEIEKTEADIKRYEQEGNIAGMERAIKHKTLLEGTRTFAQIMEKLGYGYLAGRAISSPLMPYAKATPNIVNAERERALLLQAMNRPPKAPKTP